MPLWRRILGAPDAATGILGVALAVGVCWPFIGARPLFLLDWVIGPQPPLPSAAMLGLNGGLTAGLPGAFVMTVLVRVLGEWTTWLPLALFFPIAALGVGRLCGGRRLARCSAAALYCVNPWVFNRIYAGDVMLLVGYALLPFATSSALRAAQCGAASNCPRALLPVLWWAGLTALSPHYAWIYGLVLVVSVAGARPRRWRLAGVLGVWVALFIGSSLYILLPHLGTRLPTKVGEASLALYQTSGDPHLGLFVNVAGLYGFWRLGPGPELPKSVVGGWPLLLLALLLIVAVGYAKTLSRQEAPGDKTSHGGNAWRARRELAPLLLGLGIAGYLLALGGQGPTGPLFRWAYDTLPFFAIMREPQKFLMLTVLAYAAGFGWGVERLVEGMQLRRPAAVRAVGVGVGIVLPLAYAPTIFDGLAGQLAPSSVPTAYAQADRLIGVGQGRVLYLPWELYESQPFTQGRVVANPGEDLFRRQVIVADNVQVGPVVTQSTSRRSAYLGRALARASDEHRFGAALAPLGVEYVVLAKNALWHSYGWLADQADLHRLLDTDALEVWRNLAYQGVGTCSQGGGRVRELSPVAYAVSSNFPGPVRIDASYQQGWKLDGVMGQATAQGTTVFPLETRFRGTAVFVPWGLVRLGLELSGGTLAGIGLLAGTSFVWARRRARPGC